MDGHWGETTLLLETLVKKVAGLDEDGVDLMFTVGGNDVAKQKGTSKIMSMMRNDKVHPKEGMHTDMATCLGDVFDKYIKEAKRKQNHVATLKRLTLIVLTDGIWAGTFVKEDVRSKFIVFSRALEKIIGELPVRPVSVEFIQFGNDPDATYRLRGLDDDWEYYGIRYVHSPISNEHAKLTFITGISWIQNLAPVMSTKCCWEVSLRNLTMKTQKTCLPLAVFRFFLKV
jgi:hypothetical protein